jgi:hypothetical protein
VSSLRTRRVSCGPLVLKEAKQLAHPVVSGDLADGDGILVDRDIGREVIEGKIILVCFFDFEGFVGLDGQSEGYGGIR